jgi:hypothetical protein
MGWNLGHGKLVRRKGILSLGVIDLFDRKIVALSNRTNVLQPA